jgi:hypothetical protein
MNDIKSVEYNNYFKNILLKVWVGTNWIGKNKSILEENIENSIIIDIYLEKKIEDKFILVGRTNKFYFILDCYDVVGFKYANGLFNDDLIGLFKQHKDRLILLDGNNIEKLTSVLLLSTKLQKDLLSSNSTDSIPVKKLKL